MITKTIGRLFSKPGFAVSMLILAALSWPALAQNTMTDAPASAVAASASLRSSFDHLKTGFPLKGVHLTVTCETCHIGGTFKGTPRDCAGCHSLGRPVGATPKTQDHIPTTKTCDSCHTNAASFKAVVMDHTGLTEPCSVCHGGSYPSIIKSVPQDFLHSQNSTLACDSCHKNTYTFLGAGFDHTNSISDCANCHNGTSAQGKPAGAAHIPTTAPCEACHTPSVTPGWPNPISFLGAAFDHSTIGGAACASCHGGSQLGVKTKPAAHVPTTAPCEACHTTAITPGWPNPTSFLGAIFDHSTIGGAACSSCHGGTMLGVMTKPSTHISTTVECSICHSPTSTSVGGFAYPNWVMNHVGITSGCATCHTGQTFQGSTPNPPVNKTSTPNHIPTTLDCSSCHTDATDPGGFKNWAMNHTGITSGCSNCHTGQTFSGTTPTTPVNKSSISNHISTTLDCVTCHTSTTTPGGFKTWAMNHTGIISDCASCHTGAAIGTTVVMGKPSNHIPSASTPCESCHIKTTTPGGFQTWTMNHTGFTSDCASCHASGLSFQNTIGTPLVTLNTAIHIPVGSTACEVCHSTSSTSAHGFESNWTMGVSGHNAVSGTPCATCHNSGTTFTGVKTKPSTHIAYTAGTGCDTCHTTLSTSGYTTFLNAAFDHAAAGVTLSSNCSTCHTGTLAGVMVKPSYHIATTLDCASCHTSLTVPGGFTSWTMNHTGITSGCASCHTGATVGTTVIKGMPATHIPTTAACETCHSVTSTGTGGFAAPNWTMNHAGITSGCATCHASGTSFLNAPSLVTLDATIHVPVGSLSCESCHATSSTTVGAFATAWTMGTKGHGLVSGTPCATCHDSGTTFTGVKTKPNTHIAYNASTGCDTCHTSTNTSGYTTFLNAVFNHAAAGVALGSSNCSTCHDGALTGVVAKPSYHIATTLDCATCHTSLTVPGGFTSWTMNHTGITSGCASCHTGATVGTTVIKGMPATHIPTTAACETCHSVTSTGTGGFAAPNWTMNHAGITSGCATCHNGQSFQGSVPNPPVAKPATHIATTAACESCHSTTSTGTGGFAAPNWTMNHSILPSLPPNPSIRCDSCHELGKTFQGVTITNQNTFNTHPVTFTADCGTCHNSVISFLSPVTYTHSPVPTGQCANCHNGTIALGKPAAHLVTTASCDACHNNGVFTVGGFLMTVSHTAFGSAGTVGNHQCGTSCHNDAANQTLKGATEPSTHINVGLTSIPAAAACDSCHGNTTSFLGATMNHSGITSGCATCHGGSFAGVVTKPSYHVATTLACEVCHSITSTGTGGFAAPNWTMQHTANGNTSNCASCHTGATLGTTVVLGKPANHVPTSSACEVCHSTTNTGHGGFANPNPAMNHAGIVSGCATCHTGANVGSTVTTISVGKPSNHIPTSSACETCHTSTVTPGGFATWTMSHAGISSNCASCHAAGLNFQNTSGTPIVLLNPSIHVPVGTTACELCHSPTGTSTGGFASGWTMGATGHALVTASSCATCHADSTSYTGVVKQNSIIPHIATSASCDTCHTSTNTNGYTTFLGASGPHTSNPVPTLGATCVGCHGGGTPGTVGTGGGKNMTANHIPIGALDCSACHSYTTFVLGSVSAAAVPTHSATTGVACSTCHNSGLSYAGTSGSLIVVKPTSHISTTATCNSCHTSTTAFNVWTMSHAGISSGCASCHAAGLSFTNNGGTPLVLLNPSIHVPVGTTACELCHSPTGTRTGGFVSGWTMGATGHALVAASSCATCHADSTPYTGVVKQNSIIPHIVTSAACDTCHTSSNTSGYTTFLGATGSHTSNPVPTLGATCVGCHGGGTPGTVGTGGGKNMIVNHIPIGALDCGSCHIWSSFVSPPIPTVHSMISGTACSTCHNTGSTYVGFPGGGQIVSKPSSHISTTATCNSCHTGTSYASGSFNIWTMNHTGISSGCASCHGAGLSFTNNGGTALVTLNTSIHVPVGSIACETCHSSSSTSAGSFSTAWTMGTTGHTAALASTPLCATCHGTGGSVYAGVKTIDSAHIPSSYYPAEDCGTCHTASTTGSYSIGGFTLLNGVGLPMHTNITTNCAPCHNNVIAKGTASFPTHANIGSSDCSTCHTPSNTSTYSTFLGATNGHATPPAAGSCINSGCHVSGGSGLMYTNPPHIPATGISCDKCHGLPATTSPTFLTYVSANIHGAVTGVACATCHNGSYTSQGTTGAETTTFISNHIPTLIIGASVATTSTCSTCHSGTTNWTTMTSSTAIHAGAQGGGSPIYCVTCHLSATTYLEPSGFQAKNHNGASTSKDCSSSSCHKPLGSKGTAYTNWD